MGSIGNVHGQVRVLALAGGQRHRRDTRVSVARVPAIDGLRARRRQDRPPGAAEGQAYRGSGVGTDGGDLLPRLPRSPSRGAAGLGGVGPGGRERSGTRGEGEAEAARGSTAPPRAPAFSERHAACRGDRCGTFRTAPARLRSWDPAAVSRLRSGRGAYFRETGIFPIMHVIVIKTEALERHPWLAMNLYKAFEEAKRRSVERLSDITASHAPLAWLAPYTKRMKALFGEDIWPYGLEKNRTTLQAFVDFAFEQGVCHRRLELEDLFPKQVLTSFKV